MHENFKNFPLNLTLHCIKENNGLRLEIIDNIYKNYQQYPPLALMTTTLTNIASHWWKHHHLEILPFSG